MWTPFQFIEQRETKKKKYGGDNRSHPQFLSEFLNNLSLPQLSKSHRSSLEKPFSDEEVAQVIKTLKRGSALGPDGLLKSYYKSFGPLLSPYLKGFFNSICKGKPTDSASNLTFISVIPKPGKDPAEVYTIIDPFP